MSSPLFFGSFAKARNSYWRCSLRWLVLTEFEIKCFKIVHLFSIEFLNLRLYSYWYNPWLKFYPTHESFFWMYRNFYVVSWNWHWNLSHNWFTIFFCEGKDNQLFCLFWFFWFKRATKKKSETFSVTSLKSWLFWKNKIS